MIDIQNVVFPVENKFINQLKIELRDKFYLKSYGKYIEIYGYYDNDNKIILVSVKFPNTTKPFYFTGKKWEIGIPDNFKKINPFNLTKKSKNINNIFIVNTEEQARTKIENWHGVSWIGGDAETINHTNWQLLKNTENVFIWTDKKSAKIFKNKIPQSKIIVIGKFKDCKNHLELFNSKLELNNLNVPEADPYEFNKLFINEFYGEDSLEQRNGIFWKYQKDVHYWSQEEFKDIRANFQTWFIEDREDISTSLLDYVRSEGIAINKFINNSLEFVNRHSSTIIINNPFKNSAISPYIHLENGMIYLTKKDKIVEWIERKNNNEDFFKKKYPVHCCEFDFNKKYLKDVDINDAPAFRYTIDSFIPKDLELSKIEIQKTRDFFCQIIAYAISPMKPTEYFFGLYGDEGTGKTFFIDVIKDIIGDRFFLERPIDEMTQNNRFASSDFWGSKVYVEPDMKTNSILPEAFIKTFAGQKQITLEKKHTQPERGVHISIAMFFISNFDFITKGMEGLARRMIYIPFRNKFSNPDRSLRDKIKGEEPKGIESGKYSKQQFDERPIVLALAMKGWRDFLKNDCNFTMPEWIKKSKDEWIQKSDTVKNFITENYLKNKIWIEIYRKDLYEKYADWCKEERDKHPYGKSRFYEEVGRMKNIKCKRNNGRMYEFYPELKPKPIDATELNEDENPF